MSLGLSFRPLSSLPWRRPQGLLPSGRRRPCLSPVPRVAGIRAEQGSRKPPAPRRSGWEEVLATAASLYPLYVTVGGAVACVKPSAFSWFVERGPGSYSCALGFIMLAMGLTLDLEDFFSLLVKRPLSVSFHKGYSMEIFSLDNRLRGYSPLGIAFRLKFLCRDWRSLWSFLDGILRKENVICRWILQLIFRSFADEYRSHCFIFSRINTFLRFMTGLFFLFFNSIGR